jgi:hypothetical protein
MRHLAFFVCLSFVFAASVSSPCQQITAAASPTIPNLTDVKPEILQLVVQDQWDRGNDMFGGKPRAASSTIDWKAVSERDDLRHAAAQNGWLRQLWTAICNRSSSRRCLEPSF